MPKMHTVAEFTAAAEAGERWADVLVAEALPVNIGVQRFATCHPHVPGFWLLFGEVTEALRPQVTPDAD